MKPFGWALEIECCDRMIKTPGSDLNWVEHRHWRCSKSTAIHKAKLVKHAFRIITVTALSEEQWRRAYGNPEERGF